MVKGRGDEAAIRLVEEITKGQIRLEKSPRNPTAPSLVPPFELVMLGSF